MEYAKSFPGLAFPLETLADLQEKVRGLASLEKDGHTWRPVTFPRALKVWFGDESWTFDTWPEFAERYRATFPNADSTTNFAVYWQSDDGATFVWEPLGNVKVTLSDGGTTVELTGGDRLTLLTVVEFFNTSVRSAVPRRARQPVRIFLGHGRSVDWMKLKDDLHHLHGYDVEAYEIGARAGHHIRDVLASMLERSSFALLVMTPEDEMADGGRRARQNVVHEMGLFQGRLGFDRAIAVVKEGAEVFSNLDGVHQLRYRYDIKEVVGDVLATLRREFGPHPL